MTASRNRWQAQHLLFGERGRARVKRLPPNHEADISASIKRLLQLHPAVAWAMRVNAAKGFLVDYTAMQAIVSDIGGFDVLERRFGRRPRWMEFGVPGVSDYLGQMRDGRLLALEVKASKYAPSQVSAAQRAFLDLVNNAGGLGLVGSDLARIDAVLSGRAAPERAQGGFLV